MKAFPTFGNSNLRRGTIIWGQVMFDVVQYSGTNLA